MKALFSILTSVAISFSFMAHACDNPLFHSDREVATESARESEQPTQIARSPELSKRLKPILPKGKCPYCKTDTTAWGDCWNPECEYYGKNVI